MPTKLLEDQFTSLLGQCAHDLNQGREWRAKNLISSWSGKHGIAMGFTPLRRGTWGIMEFRAGMMTGLLTRHDGDVWVARLGDPVGPSKYPDFFRTFGFGTGGLFVDIVRRITGDTAI